MNATSATSAGRGESTGRGVFYSTLVHTTSRVDPPEDDVPKASVGVGIPRHTQTHPRRPRNGEIACCETPVSQVSPLALRGSEQWRRWLRASTPETPRPRKHRLRGTGALRRTPPAAQTGITQGTKALTGCRAVAGISFRVDASGPRSDHLRDHVNPRHDRVGVEADRRSKNDHEDIDARRYINKRSRR